MTCNHCGKTGHKYADCWQREENATKRPQNYKLSAEQGQANMNEKKSKIEYLMAGITFPKDHKILSDPNVQITDTAATVQTTPHSFGMSDGKKATGDDSITVGNGDKEPAPQIASITEMICDKHGNELKMIKLMAVTHLPPGKFNLFSLTQMQQKGWLLSGNGEVRWLTTGNRTSTFDLVVT